jgi:hypothetical protein
VPEAGAEGVLAGGGRGKRTGFVTAESATGAEYLSKSGGFGAYRLPFREALA